MIATRQQLKNKREKERKKKEQQKKNQAKLKDKLKVDTKVAGIPGVMYKGSGKDPAVQELLKKLKKGGADSLDSSGFGNRYKV
tara:strand:+ start:1652 stop:1900 length:249 start_codon:yes stop_codon:yes gene_type:complete